MEFVEAGTACMNLVAAGATLWNSYRTISSDNRFWVNQKMFDHELSMHSAKFARERENNHCEAKEKFKQEFDSYKLYDSIRYISYNYNVAPVIAKFKQLVELINS